MLFFSLRGEKTTGKLVLGAVMHHTFTAFPMPGTGSGTTALDGFVKFTSHGILQKEFF